uniref:U2A'/phosphoprotein 32 family A C-terminal domain-containing protein n=1 Tax=Salix viminalis TaxID=40686 RepID=A0A6N2K1V8_SALVM
MANSWAPGEKMLTAVIGNKWRLNNLTSLRHLRISSNHIEGFKSFHELEALSNLTKLYLSGNEIDEFVFSSRGIETSST